MSSLDSYQNKEYIKSKVYDLLHNDSLSLIIEYILPFLFPNKVQVISNVLQADIEATDEDLVLESSKKVSMPIKNNTAAAYSISQDDENSVLSSAKCPYELSSLDPPLPIQVRVLSSAKLIDEPSSTNLPLPNKRKKICQDSEQRKRNILLKIRRLHELQYAAQCTHDYISSYLNHAVYQNIVLI